MLCGCVEGTHGVHGGSRDLIGGYDPGVLDFGPEHGHRGIEGQTDLGHLSEGRLTDLLIDGMGTLR